MSTNDEQLGAFQAALTQAITSAADRHGADAVRQVIMSYLLRHEAELRAKLPPDDRTIRVLDEWHASRGS